MKTLKLNSNGIVLFDGQKAFTTSLAIADGVCHEHRAVIQLLKTHSNNEILSTFQMRKVSTKGRSIQCAILDELQATFLITLMKNSKKVVLFKTKLSTEFFNQRKIISNLIAQKNDPDWKTNTTNFLSASIH